MFSELDRLLSSSDSDDIIDLVFFLVGVRKKANVVATSARFIGESISTPRWSKLSYIDSITTN